MGRSTGLRADSLVNHPQVLYDLTESFNALTERSDSPEDILHYIRNERKCGRWVRLGRQKVTAPPETDGNLTEPEMIALSEIYLIMGRECEKGNDSFAHDAPLARELERRFIARCGRYVLACHLIAALTDYRKNRNLPRLDLRGHGFADFDDVANL